jgi:hypothetical protein
LSTLSLINSHFFYKDYIVKICFFYYPFPPAIYCSLATVKEDCLQPKTFFVSAVLFYWPFFLYICACCSLLPDGQKNSVNLLKTCPRKCPLQKKICSRKITKFGKKVADKRPENLIVIINLKPLIIACIFLDFVQAVS